MRVYKFGLLTPSCEERLVREQLRAAHEYRNDLVAIERGRRVALRSIDRASSAVLEAEELVRTATRSTRKARITELRAARKAARAEAADELARIKELDKSIRRDARALTPTFWGTYLGIEAAHQQSRSQPLYGDDAVTDNDPRFVRGPPWRDSFAADDPRGIWWLSEGQLGMQLQKGLPTTNVLACTDSRVQVEIIKQFTHGRRKGHSYGKLRLRIGSDGRDPIWAEWPIEIHRAIPRTALWKWVRVSVRPWATTERWSCEITVDEMPGVQRGQESHGALAVEWEWSPCKDGIRVARWCDDAGESGDVVLPARIADGTRKSDGIRSVRDTLTNALKEQLPALIKSDKTSPAYAQAEAATMHLWKSPQRFRALAMRWALDAGAGEAFDLLQAWEKRDLHLYRYEAGARGNALGQRRDYYRCLARRWRERYGTVLLSSQDLSREARYGDDSDVRFTAGVSKLRDAIRNAFGVDDAVDARWTKADAQLSADDQPWRERVRDAWISGGTRGDEIFAAKKEKTANAWAKRRAKKTAKSNEGETSRGKACNAV